MKNKTSNPVKITKWDTKLCKIIVPGICPLCKETKLFNPSSSGGVEGFEHTWFKKFIRVYSYRQKKYRCHSCGAKWESYVIKEPVIHKGE